MPAQTWTTTLQRCTACSEESKLIGVFASPALFCGQTACRATASPTVRSALPAIMRRPADALTRRRMRGHERARDCTATCSHIRPPLASSWSGSTSTVAVVRLFLAPSTVADACSRIASFSVPDLLARRRRKDRAPSRSRAPADANQAAQPLLPAARLSRKVRRRAAGALSRSIRCQTSPRSQLTPAQENPRARSLVRFSMDRAALCSRRARPCAERALFPGLVRRTLKCAQRRGSAPPRPRPRPVRSSAWRAGVCRHTRKTGCGLSPGCSNSARRSGAWAACAAQPSGRAVLGCCRGTNLYLHIHASMLGHRTVAQIRDCHDIRPDRPR
jgi:hypothetical protein